MRNSIKIQLQIGDIAIENIEINPQCRDEIPQILLGLQALYKDEVTREKIFQILQKLKPKDVNTDIGRPGMYLWNIFVIATFKLTNNIDYDKLHNLCNEHKTLRLMLGHSAFDDKRYSLQTLKDNIKLFTPEIISEINAVVVKKAHKDMGLPTDAEINARCDSVHVPTNVHFPTDINLLFDAIRKIIILIMNISGDFSLKGWREGASHIRKVKNTLRKIQITKHSTSKNEKKREEKKVAIKAIYEFYLELAADIMEKAEASISDLKATSNTNLLEIINEIEKFIAHAKRQKDQINRRVLKGETIPHNEKIFSLFEEYTEWLCKGKAGVLQVLGLNVCIITDQHGFILEHIVMQKETDSNVAVKIVKNAQENFSNIISCSFDKGFHSPQNQIDLATILEKVFLPKKGKLSEARKEIEYSPEFLDARKAHSKVEGSIGCLVNHGLDICRDRGIDGFKRHIAFAMTARNIQHLGNIIRQKELKKLKRATKKRKLNLARQAA
ncbi:MAG: ISNCY family transposase [Candidatus Cloacimonadota bacterium]|nr:ISNCY family transposase [Candidatus Cloacimonadota bacterium]